LPHSENGALNAYIHAYLKENIKNKCAEFHSEDFDTGGTQTNYQSENFTNEVSCKLAKDQFVVKERLAPNWFTYAPFTENQSNWLLCSIQSVTNGGACEGVKME
jgi:hypothetical protein